MTYHVGQVVQVDQDLVDTRPVERVKPDIEQGLAINSHHALRNGVGDRPQPAAHSGGEQEGFHPPAFRTTPRARIRAFASVSTPSRPSIPLSQAAYAATESAGVRRGCHPTARR